MPRFQAAIASLMRLRNFVLAELLLIALVYAIGLPRNLAPLHCIGLSHLVRNTGRHRREALPLRNTNSSGTSTKFMRSASSKFSSSRNGITPADGGRDLSENNQCGTEMSAYAPPSSDVASVIQNNGGKIAGLISALHQRTGSQ